VFHVKRQSTGTPDKPVLDEGAFQQILSAAFLLQQHKERLQENGTRESAFGQILTRVVEIREQIRNHQLDLQATTTLVARRIREMTEASGAAVGILNGNDLEYLAATGSASRALGTRAPFDLSLAAECLRTGLILRCPESDRDNRLKLDLCGPLHIQSLIAVPIMFETRAVGVLELHFAQANGFHEEDVCTCHLLAALLAETSAEEEGARPGTSLPEHPIERMAPADTASMREALGKMNPQLESVGRQPASLHSKAGSSEMVCPGCGHPLAEGESFCELCDTSCQTPSIWSSLWKLQLEAEKSGNAQKDFAGGDSSDGLGVSTSELEDIVAQISREPADAKPSSRVKLPSSSLVAPLPTMPDLERVNGNGLETNVISPPYTPSTNVPPQSVCPNTEARLPVRIFGTDAGGKVFSENVFTVDVSREGAKLIGVRAQIKIGEIVGIRHELKKSRFSVKWVGQRGTAHEGQIRVQNITPENNIWDVSLADIGVRIYARKSASGNERRQHPRMGSSVSVRLHPECDGAPIWGTALELSSGGCFVDMPMSFSRDTKVRVGLWLKQTKLMLTGRVASSRSGSGIGIQFTDVGPQDAAHLHYYLKSIAQIATHSIDARLG
jgi:hypothetical protein